MATATLNSQSQIVVPAEIRRRLRLKAGDRLVLAVEGEQVIMRKLPESHLSALGDFDASLWKNYAEELTEERDRWGRR